MTTPRYPLLPYHPVALLPWQVSLDYYIQGFCLSSLTLRPSAFYAAANIRTVAIRSAIWHSTSANASAAKAKRPPSCVGDGGGGRNGRRGAPPSLDACQLQLCGLSDCNLNQ